MILLHLWSEIQFALSIVFMRWVSQWHQRFMIEQGLTLMWRWSNFYPVVDGGLGFISLYEIYSIHLKKGFNFKLETTPRASSCSLQIWQYFNSRKEISLFWLRWKFLFLFISTFTFKRRRRKRREIKESQGSFKLRIFF